jgi:cytochrome c biogenesis protein CcmG/thiol:disulfide interchange protein DsbE
MVPTNELEPAPPPRRRRTLIAGIAIVVVGGLLIVGLQRAPPQRVAPAFTLPRLEGAGAISSAHLKGTPVVVNFFASWCVPCREEAPLLEKAWLRFKGQGVQFVGVNVTDTKSAARDFVRKFGITYPVVTDYPLTFAQKMRVPGLPITYFIDKDGHFLSTAVGKKVGVQHSGTTVLGAISSAELQKGVEALLGR